MDDLLGLDWKDSKQEQKTSTPSFPSVLQSQTPSASGRSTPVIPRPSSTANSQPSLKIGSKPATPANDSFASLLGGAPKQTNNLSLQERQRRLQEEKAKKQAEEKKRLDSQFGSQNDAFWNGFGGAQNGQKISGPPGTLSSQSRN